MKNFINILLVLAIAACTFRTEEQNFVNPIFNKEMVPLSTGTWYTRIMPTKMVRTYKGDTIIQKCTLTENTMAAVTLRCEGPDPDNRGYILIYRFVLRPENKDYGGMLVNMLYRSPDELEEFTSQESLIIPERTNNPAFGLY